MLITLKMALGNVIPAVDTSIARFARHSASFARATLFLAIVSLMQHVPAHADCVGAAPNGVVQAGEECDDNDASNNDFCLTNCTYAACGDNIVCTSGDCHFAPGLTGPEHCDDGVFNSDVTADACRTSCIDPSCGDGTRDPGSGEDCDDGNTSDSDACPTTCRNAVCGDGFVRMGIEECDDGNASNTDVCVTGCVVASCGDGFARTSVEACDDGNSVNTDGCANDCRLPLCGNGIVQAGEECDDSNAVNTLDACPNTCQNHECGDGILALSESCDDGNDVDTDACKNDCTRAVCGDGVVHIGFEVCDDGNASNLDACKSDCTANSCGDGHQRAGVEECDLGALNSDTSPDRCRTDCTRARCGDGVVDTAENCDDGNDVDADACRNACWFAACGDGVVCTDPSCTSGPGAGKEACDDGNANDFDGCSGHCAVEGCGDGVLQVPEECDAGASSPPEPREAPGCDADCTFRECGDGYINEAFGEQCDDGDVTSGDGCNAECESELCGDGIVQIGIGEECDEGSANNDVLADACRTNCRLPRCGDGVVDTSESCDDENIDESDACKNDCKPNVCGDYILQKGVEGCDDGDRDNADECPNSCKAPTCGDGIIQTEFGEECDEGPSVCTGGADEGAICVRSSQCRGVCGAPNPGYPCTPNTDIAECGRAGACNMVGVACDDMGNNDDEADACRSSCRQSYCGDGVIDSNEDCDSAVPGVDRPCMVRTVGGRSSLVPPYNCALATCGDGIRCADGACTTGPGGGPEECDDGNAIDTDGCKNDCSANTCGDGVVARGVEECDDGRSICHGGYDAGRLCVRDADCRGNCARGTPNVGAPCETATDVVSCGQPGTCNLTAAVCDDAGNSDQATNACRSDCNLWYCGDGVADASEDCDDGNNVNGDACTNRCVFPVCGDGIVCDDPGCTSGFGGGFENCDDGNRKSFDGCSSNCQIEGCGDGIVQPDEQCDGAPLGTNPPVAAESSTCDVDCTLATCGDQIVNSTRGEACDDGNTVAGDGCDGVCGDEFCGDGIDNDGAAEECDFGTANSDRTVDGCRTNCRRWHCGDKVTDTGENCDAGGETATCDIDCTLVVCGDGRVNATAGEECDDGAANADAPNACRVGRSAYSKPCTLPRAGDGIVDTARGEICDAGPDGDASCSPDGCSTGKSPSSFRNGYHGAKCELDVIEAACVEERAEGMESCERAATIHRRLRRVAELLARSQSHLSQGRLPLAARNARWARRRARTVVAAISDLCPEAKNVQTCLANVHLPRLIDTLTTLEVNIVAIDP